jgi:hypothetical protein
MTREEVYEEIAEKAAENGLILQAFGGTMVIVHPDTQKAEGIEEKCLYMAGLGPFPGNAF